MVIGFTPGQAAAVGFESFTKTGSTMFFSSEVNRDDPVDFPLEETEQFLIKSQYTDPGEEYHEVVGSIVYQIPQIAIQSAPGRPPSRWRHLRAGKTAEVRDKEKLLFR